MPARQGCGGVQTSQGFKSCQLMGGLGWFELMFDLHQMMGKNFLCLF